MQTHIVQKIINSNEQLDTKKEITIISRTSKSSKRIHTKVSREFKTITTKIKERCRIPVW